MKIIKNGDELIGIERFSINAFSPEKQQEFLKAIKESGLTIEEAYEKIGKSIEDMLITRFEKQNSTFPEMYKLKLKTDWKNKAIKYQKFYEYIKYLLKNANLDEKLVREKIEEMEREIENE